MSVHVLVIFPSMHKVWFVHVHDSMHVCPEPPPPGLPSSLLSPGATNPSTISYSENPGTSTVTLLVE